MSKPRNLRKVALGALLLAASLSSFAANPAGAKLADEALTQGTQFTLGASSLVSYGFDNRWVEKTLAAGTYTCGDDLFPSDPAADVRKECRLTNAPVAVIPSVLVAGQGGYFTLTTATAIKFGNPNGFYQKTLVPGTYLCQSTFMGDPPGAVGQNKSCYTVGTDAPSPPQSPNQSGTTAPTNPTPVYGKIADEGGGFVLSSQMNVRFGAGSSWYVKQFAAGQYACNSGQFNNTDPAYGVAKVCETTGDPVTTTTPTTPTAPTVSSFVAGQGGTFTLTTPTAIKFGNVNGFYQKTLVAGTYTCQSNFMGDPPGAVGQNKSCYLVGTDAESPPQSPNREGTGETTSGGGSTGGGGTTTPTNPTTPTTGHAIDTPAKYRAVAATFGYEAGITYRYGVESTLPRTTTSYPTNRPVRSYSSLAGDSGVTQQDGVRANRGCSVNGYCGVYNIGDRLFGNTDDYSSSIGNVAYIPVKPVPNGIYNKTYLGFGSAEILNMGHNTMSTIPQPSWTTYINTALDNTLNDENVARYAGIQGGYDRTKFDFKICPVASARGYGRGGWTTNAIGLTCDGMIFGYGSNTAHNFFKLKAVRDGLVPTNLAISNSGEFAFITAWDTTNIKGKVIVVALSDACQWCAGEPESNWNRNWGNHRQEYPGLPGLGNYSNAKVIGEIDLPDSLTGPTEIAVTTGKPKRDGGYERIQDFWTYNLLSEANRAKYFNGEWTDAIPRTGMLAVSSKSEQRVAFIDLRPLFQFYRTQYLTKNQADWNTLINSRGPAASQWPYTFDVAPSQKPTLIKVVDFDSQVTALQLTRNAPHRALIGRMDGAMDVYDLGTGYLDQRAALTGAPADIKKLFSVDIGANVTSIAFKKETNEDGGTMLYAAGTKTMENFFWVSSRGTNTAKLIEFNTAMTSASARYTLQDSAVRDMIKVEDGDNHGTESYVLTVVDYEGMAIHNFMYGPIKMKTARQDVTPCPTANPCRLRDNKQFELAGTLRFPGKPFNMSTSNIN